jgi:hypothetical protein
MSLTNITVSEDNTNYASIDGVLFNKDKTKLIRYPAGNPRTDYVIPSSVTTVQIGAFGTAYNLESVTIPDSVTTINRGAFNVAEKLSTIIGGDNVVSVGSDAFYGTAWLNNQHGLVYVGRVAHIWEGRMLDNTTVILREGTVSISPNAFRARGSYLQWITIPESVELIGAGAFRNSQNLTTVVFLSKTPPEMIWDGPFFINYNPIFPHNTNLTIFVPEGSQEAYQAVRVLSDIEILEYSVPPCNCYNCSDCDYLGGRFGFGRVTNSHLSNRPVVQDAVAILRYIVGLSSPIADCDDARAAANITVPGLGEPIVQDAIAILRFLVGLPSILDNI